MKVKLCIHVRLLRGIITNLVCCVDVCKAERDWMEDESPDYGEHAHSGQGCTSYTDQQPSPKDLDTMLV